MTYLLLLTFNPSHYTGFPLFPFRKLVVMSVPTHIGALHMGHILWLLHGNLLLTFPGG